MSELSNQIKDYFESIAPAVEARREAPRYWWRLRPLLAVGIGAAVVAIPILVVWATVGRSAESDPTVPPATTLRQTTLTPDATTNPPTTQLPTTTSPIPDLETVGRWLPLGEGLRAFQRPTRIQTDDELLIFPQYEVGDGSSAAGMALDYHTGGWRSLPPAPEVRGNQPAVVWTGTQVLVWGGSVGISDPPRLTNDGYAFNPQTDEWTAIPAGPLSPQAHPFHVWTGEELIIWGGSELVDGFFLGGSVEGAAFNPSTQQWRALAPSPLGSRNPGVAIWTGSVMIVGGNGDQTDGDASWASYDPEADTWAQLPDPPVRAGNVYGGVWTGSEVIFSTDESGSGTLYAYNPTSNQWRQPASPGVRLLGAGFTWTGDYVIYWGNTGFPERLVQMTYDPIADKWTELAPSPLSSRHAFEAVTAVTPEITVVWGGIDSAGTALTDGALFVLDDGPVQMQPNQASALATSLLAVAGNIARAGDIPWDPDGVGIGLGSTILETVDPAQLTDAAAWELDVEHYNAADGPFSVLNGVNELAAIDDLIVQMGPHNHCVSQPKPPPAGLGSLLRVSMQPASMDSCLEWFTIDIFVTPEGNISAITYDFWEP